MVKATEKKEKIEKYFEAVGRRKTSVARVRLFKAKKDKNDIQVNEKELHVYFPLEELRNVIKSPFKTTNTEKEFYVTIKTNGGGIKSQAEAIRLGISRALLKYEPTMRQALKAEKFLTRDGRAKERRKFGLKKARKAPQWSKR